MNSSLHGLVIVKNTFRLKIFHVSFEKVRGTTESSPGLRSTLYKVVLPEHFLFRENLLYLLLGDGELCLPRDEAIAQVLRVLLLAPLLLTPHLR